MTSLREAHAAFTEHEGQINQDEINALIGLHRLVGRIVAAMPDMEAYMAAMPEVPAPHPDNVKMHALLRDTALSAKPCDSGCAFEQPYGFVIASGCPVHEPLDTQKRCEHGRTALEPCDGCEAECIEVEGCCETHSPCMAIGADDDALCTGWPCPQTSTSTSSSQSHRGR